MSPKSQSKHPKIIARACLFCRQKKIRCDTARPRCATCVGQNRDCVYHLEAPGKRPTLARIHELQNENAALLSMIARLQAATPSQRDALLTSTSLEPGQLWEVAKDENESGTKVEDAVAIRSRRDSYLSDVDSEDEEMDVAPFISVDESGNLGNFGPSSALNLPTQNESTASSRQNESFENRRNTLIANAALQRQSEPCLTLLPEIGGVSTQVALHLLNVHWTRQHHTFLLTYRPAIIRDLQHNGPHCSVFLLKAIFACSIKFSEMEQEDNHFFRQCETMLTEGALITKPTIPTLIGLLLLGSTCIAQGETSKGWLFTGYALRMVYDLGLNIDPQETTSDPEEIEIRRRVFWGAFVCDKLQSLYLGRPVAINSRGYRVSRELLDTFEEKELFLSSAPCPSPMYSTSTFQQLCLLSKIMTLIINRFYVVGASFSNAHANLQMVDNALASWKKELPAELNVNPSSENPTSYPAPNVMVLNAIYYALIILLYRPFISDGHLRSKTTPQNCWERCTDAAHLISCIARSYQTAYGIAKAPYILSYTIYVAGTIHVRNVAGDPTSNLGHKELLISSIDYLNKMSHTNSGVKRPLSIIKQLMKVNKISFEIGSAPLPQAVEAFDLGMIFSTFPPDRRNRAPGSTGGNNDSMIDYRLDPLFGLMDYTSLSFDDFPSSEELLMDDPII